MLDDISFLSYYSSTRLHTKTNVTHFIYTHTHREKERGVLLVKCHLFKWLISHIRFHGFRFLSSVQKKKKIRVSWTLAVKKAAKWRNSLLQKFGKSSLYCIAFTIEAPIQRLQNIWGVNLRTIQRIRKVLEEANDHYEGTTAQYFIRQIVHKRIQYFYTRWERANFYLKP